MPKPKIPLRGSTAIPGPVGDSFLEELSELVARLAQEGGFKEQYLERELLSKYCDSTTTSPADRRTAAIDKWLAVEEENARTNTRLMLCEPEYKFGKWLTFGRFKNDCRVLISRILGPLDYPSVLAGGSHTNGASTRVRRSPNAAILKLSGEAHISDSALKHWFAAFSNTQLSNQTLVPFQSSMLFTVPKKSEIDRVAAKEPECNMLLQRSVGNHIRRRLKVFGIDLNDQSVNRELARTAVAANLATVDLSSASDTITRQLIIELLPFEWWSLLDDLRVSTTLIDGKEHFLEMFSSMGNGFTFELESLLFYAITRVVCWRSGVKGRISVYGDDIICPSRVIPRLKRMFHFLGFKMNPKKTHGTGFFRESCGGHYWRGFDVTPFYVRREVRELPDLINHLNRLLEWNGRGWGFFTSEEAYQFWLKWRNHVPQALWGGIDPSDPTCLVTGHPPRKRLVPRTRGTYRPARESLVHWLLNREHCEEPLAVDPRLPVGFVFRPVISRGERTAWDPGAAWQH